MEQTSNVVMSMLQTMASQAAGIPKTGKGDLENDFQKLLEEKSQEKDPLLEEPAKSETKPQASAPKKDKAPVQKQEDPVEQAKKLAEQGAWFTQPGIGFVDMDLATGEIRAAYEPGEYILAHLGERTEVIPITSLDPDQMQELKQILGDLGQVIDVSDPEADAMLEATDPTVEHGPAQLLEKMAGQEAGQTVQKAAAEAQPQEDSGEDGGSMMELTAGQQAPQRVFRDVEAVPVKVGEASGEEQAETPNVAQQIDVQLAQALERGESMVRIRLNPENLGEVTVEISQSADGILRVALSAHSGETRSLLERHAGDLQGLLNSRTQQTVEVEVQRGQESQQNQNQQRQQGYDGHNGHAQDGQEQERRQRRAHTSSQDFMQQLRLGLIPMDGES